MSDGVKFPEGEDLTAEAPFYDDYDSDKQYSKILPVPGRHLQNREFIQSQTNSQEFMRRISDLMIRDGNRPDGMDWRISGDEIVVSDGRVYIGGLIHVFKEQSLPFTGEGQEIVGVMLERYLVDHEDDSSLLNPTENLPGSGQPGAARVKSVPVIVMNHPDAVPIYEFEDGELQRESAQPQYDALEDVLARRTFETNGSFRVAGLELVTEPSTSEAVQLTVEAGIAYIMGYEVRKPTPMKDLIPISKDTADVIGEPKTYRSSVDKYALNHFPAASITRVLSTVERTENVTRGGVIGGTDFLSHSPVNSIRHVADANRSYVIGQDFNLVNDGVSWDLDGNEPSVGSTYTVTYWHNKVMTVDDYELYQETGAWGETRDYLRFKQGGDKPVVDSTISVDYKHFLARVDLVSMDIDGQIVITTGQPDNPRNVTPPHAGGDTLLHLGTIYCPPNSANMRATVRVINTVTMEEIQDAIKRISDLEYGLAMTALEREAEEGELPTDLRGIFVDSFTSITKGDVSHPDFNVMYALEEGMIMLPLAKVDGSDPTIDFGNSDVEQWSRVVTAPMTEIVAIDQHHATTTERINPFMQHNTMASMKLNPEVDNWIDDTFIEVEKTRFEARNIARWFVWREREIGRGRVERAHGDMMDRIELDSGEDIREIRPGLNEVVMGTVTDRTRSVMSEAITHMRQRDVEIDCRNLNPSTDNLECLFDGVRAPLTPLPGYQAGSENGTVRSNTKGRVRAKFHIPAGIRTGTREVVLRNASNSAVAPYTANGTKRTTTDTVLRTRMTLTYTDPIAQSIEFEQDTVLTAFGVYFASKTPNHNVVVQVRNMINGYPGSQVYAEHTLEPEECLVSSNASRETKVSFDQPVLCEANKQYCIVYLSDSPTDNLYISKTGGRDVRTGHKVTWQAYAPGTMFVSSNNKTWNARQDQNLKFKAYRAEFASKGVIEFNPIENIESDKLVLMADFLTPRNTGCIWEMRINNGSYQPIASFRETELTQVAERVQLKAIFRADRRMSPILALDSFSLLGFLSETSGAYISRNVEMDRRYTTVKQVFEGHIPPGCTIQPKFSFDNGESWISATLTSERQVNSTFTKYEWEAEVPEEEYATNYRARLDLSAPSPIVRPRARKFKNIMK